MPLKVWNGSSWIMVPRLHVWNGSAWVALNATNNAKTARTWNGSSWVQFHPGVRLDEYGGTDVISLYHSMALAVSSDTAQVGITLQTNGTMDYWYADTYTPQANFTSYSWLLSGANSEYYAYMDNPSSGSFSSGTTATALQLNSNRSWTKSQTGGGSSNVQSVLRIRDVSGTDIVTINIDFTAEVIP